MTLIVGNIIKIAADGDTVATNFPVVPTQRRAMLPHISNLFFENN